MTHEEILVILEAMGWPEHKNFRTGWVTIACPLAQWNHGGGKDNHPSFGIKVGDDPALCVCLSCGYGGPLPSLMSDLIARLPPGYPGRKQAVKIMQELPVTPTKKGLTMPVKTTTTVTTDPVIPETWLDQFLLASGVEVAVKYLMDRGLPFSHIERMELRFDMERRRILFPIRDWSGQLRGVQGRAILTKDQPKYLFYKYNGVACGHSVMLGEHLVDTEKPVILVEGAFDYAKLRLYTKQVLVLWGARITPTRIDRLNRLTKIYTAFDADDAGSKARFRAKIELPNSTNLVLPAGIPDVGEADHDTLARLASYVDNFGKLG